MLHYFISIICIIIPLFFPVNLFRIPPIRNWQSTAVSCRFQNLGKGNLFTYTYYDVCDYILIPSSFVCKFLHVMSQEFPSINYKLIHSFDQGRCHSYFDWKKYVLYVLQTVANRNHLFFLYLTTVNWLCDLTKIIDYAIKFPYQPIVF